MRNSAGKPTTMRVILGPDPAQIWQHRAQRKGC